MVTSKGGKSDNSDIGRHKKYLAEPSPEWINSRLEMFRIDRKVFDVLPIICIEDEISSRFAKWRDWIHPLEPISLDDLKNWFGVPNHIAQQQLRTVQSLTDGGHLWGRYSRISPRRLPKKEFDFGRLEEEQRTDVLQTANNLLYGYVDPEEAKQPEVRAVVAYMIERAKASRVSIFVAPNLIVCPDTEVIFSNLPAMMFTNILIYGNGRITTKGHMSIHAQQIEHVNA